LNPVLGEVFYGTWPDTNGRGVTELLVEQVSHHPPITAYIIENKSKGLKLIGHNAQKTSFSSGAIIVKQIGHAVLTISPSSPSTPVENYLITLPRLRIEGLWYGSPYTELADTSYIIGGGHVVTLEYKGKGYFSGKSHSFKATMTPMPGQGGQGRGDIVVEGTWHETSKFIKVPLEWTEESGDLETRKLWHLVAKGIREGDFELASREKSKIENDQRQRRRDEQANGTTWPLKHFDPEESDPIYERLGRVVKITPATEDAYVFKGNWLSGFKLQ
jgi:hypothetical protein